MISLDLMKSLEVRIAGDQSNNVFFFQFFLLILQLFG